MKYIRGFFIGTIIIGSLAASLNFLHAQTAVVGNFNSNLSLVQAAAPDSIVQITADAEGLSLVSPGQAPRTGTFWWILPSGTAVPAPCPPQDALTAAIYQLAAGQFLVDETGGQIPAIPRRFGMQAQIAGSTAVSGLDSGLEIEADTVMSLITRVQMAAASQQMRMMGMNLPMPGGDGGSGSDDTNSFYSTSFNFAPDHGTNLWIGQVGISSGNLTGILSNSVADVQYELQYKTALMQSDWQSAGWFVFGSELTNWTPFSVSAFSPTNLFLRVRSWQDDGSGLPLWWQDQYFGTNGVDPYGDPAGDGWNNLQKFQNGMNPYSFYTPPAPQAVSVSLNQSSKTAGISWQPSPGSVTNYVVEKTDTYTYPPTVEGFNVSPSLSSYQDDISGDTLDPYNGNTYDVSYRVLAQYASGNSAWSAPQPLQQVTVSGSIVPGTADTTYLAVSGLPANAAAVRLVYIDWSALYGYNDDSFDSSQDIPVSDFTNGEYELPEAFQSAGPDIYGNTFSVSFVQSVDASGNASAASPLNNNFWGQPFYDGRVQMKQNLVFLLRAGLVDSPFAFLENLAGGGYHNFDNPPNYAYASFYDFYYSLYCYQNNMAPFRDNYLYRNFVFNLSNVDETGDMTTGVEGYYDVFSSAFRLLLQDPPTYEFQPPATTWTTIPALLATNDTRWLCSYPFDSSYDLLWEIGAYSNNTNQLGYVTTMFNNVRNLYGLPFLSAEIAYSTINNVVGTYTLNAGSSTTQSVYYIYPETAQPQFQTVEYDFWNTSVDAIPGSLNFSPTNTSRLLIATPGNEITVAGYAKLAIQNGYTNVFGYLGQYFDKAYVVTNGVVTTNSAGFVDPYGNFFATEPGPAALVTMPDIDTGQQGTATVYCISLNVDANHDGTMDTSFNGPDATSANSPFVFWANNNFDRWDDDGMFLTPEQDDVLPGGSDPQNYDPNDPDCNYKINGYRAIPDTRDLEDFARLWICGVTSNFLAALPPNSTVTLSWGDVGSPNPSNPAIDIFQAADPDGGIGYLTNETIAAAQLDPYQGSYVGPLGPGQSIQLNANHFGSTWWGNHFIWCGVSNGSGGLTLTIADGGGNVLAQTTAYIQIADIKNMYERWTVGDNPNQAPLIVATNACNDLPGPTPFQYTPPTDPNIPYILHVHGYNMKTWEKDRFAETEYKRLYWQGYQGRFGEFRWPTTQQRVLNLFSAFNLSESNAWASATGLLNLLTSLNAEYPGQVYLTAHSHGNVVAGEALRLAGNNQLVNTYIAMQGAVDSHTYDPTTPTRLVTFSTPDRYGQYYTNGASGYFNGSAGAGTYVNFFNTNDWALSANVWQQNQNLKPDSAYEYKADSDTWWTDFFYGTQLIFPRDTYAIFSYGDQAHGYALGAQPDVGGAFTIARQVNLQNVWPPDPLNNNYRAHIWHSAEFRSDIAQRWQLWNAVLTQMKLK